MIHASRRATRSLQALSSSFASSFSPSLSPSSLRLASSFTRSSPQRASLNSKCLVQPSTRNFSTLLSRLQQATAEVDPSPERPEEFTRFDELAEHGLISPNVINTITKRMRIETMTEVQRMTINHCLDGSDVIAQAKTGTGKTLAFLLPIVQRILRDPSLERPSRQRAGVGDIRALIISPTRELAEQIAVEAKKIVANTSVKVQTAVGGTQKSQHLRQMKQEGCHILVGTPGRVQDIISDRSTGVSLDNIQTFVLDEADRLLDIGFAPAIAEIQQFMPDRKESSRQTLMFSATVPKSVVQLVRETLRPDFKFIRTVDPDEAPTHERIPQKVVFGQGLQNQIPIIMEIANNAIEAHKKDPANNMPFKAIVYFGSTAEVAMTFEAFSKMRDPDQPRSLFQSHPLDPCRIFQMHGKLAQAQRTRESQNFRTSSSAILFSSDVTARGMDFPDVSHVIQIGLPRSSDDYVHRIGRTGRAGKSGEGWLILNDDERQDVVRRLRSSGINLQEADLVTGKLDMTKGAQIPANIARLLKLVEVGVKSVPYNTKSATYAALLGVLQQQNPNRQRQVQLDMMNDLAKFGWGMTEPPALSKNLVQKIGFSGLRGLRIEDAPRREFDDRQGGRGFGRDDRGGGRGFGRDDRGGERGFGRDDRGGGRGFGRDDRGAARGGGRGFGRDDRGGRERGYGNGASHGKGVFGGSPDSGDPFDNLGMGRGSRR